jgi:hypothetical protein
MRNMVCSFVRLCTLRTFSAAEKQPAIDLSAVWAGSKERGNQRPDMRHSHQYDTTGSAFFSSFARLRICSQLFNPSGTRSDGMSTSSMSPPMSSPCGVITKVFLFLR